MQLLCTYLLSCTFGKLSAQMPWMCGRAHSRLPRQQPSQWALPVSPCAAGMLQEAVNGSCLDSRAASPVDEQRDCLLEPQHCR